MYMRRTSLLSKKQIVLSKYAEIRSADNLKSRFAIIDAKDMMFMILNDDNVHQSYDVGVWVNTPFFANTMEQLFESAWKDMTPLSKMKI